MDSSFVRLMCVWATNTYYKKITRIEMWDLLSYNIIRGLKILKFCTFEIRYLIHASIWDWSSYNMWVCLSHMNQTPLVPPAHAAKCKRGDYKLLGSWAASSSLLQFSKLSVRQILAVTCYIGDTEMEKKRVQFMCVSHTHTIRGPITHWHVDWNFYYLL